MKRLKEPFKLLYRAFSSKAADSVTHSIMMTTVSSDDGEYGFHQIEDIDAAEDHQEFVNIVEVLLLVTVSIFMCMKT